MAVAVLSISSGTYTSPSTLPIAADGTLLEGPNTTTKAGLVPTTANTSAGTGELDGNQGVLFSTQGFAELIQFIGLAASAWSCTPRAAWDRLRLQGDGMFMQPNLVPTGG